MITRYLLIQHSSDITPPPVSYESDSAINIDYGHPLIMGKRWLYFDLKNFCLVDQQIVPVEILSSKRHPLWK